MRFRTSIITAAAMLALAAPVAANAAAGNASRAVIGGGTTSNTRPAGSITTVSTGKAGKHLLVDKNRPAVIVGAASPQPLGTCTTVMVEGYLLETTCGTPTQSESSSSGTPSASSVAATASSTSASPAPTTPLRSGCTTGLYDGYLLITYC
jgi:hypothetical protein